MVTGLLKNSLAMFTESMLEELKSYIMENIENFDERLSYAWGQIDKYRCPLEYADKNFFDECLECLEDFCDDNEINIDGFFEDYDLEDLVLYDD